MIGSSTSKDQDELPVWVDPSGSIAVPRTTAHGAELPMYPCGGMTAVAPNRPLLWSVGRRSRRTAADSMIIQLPHRHGRGFDAALLHGVFGFAGRYRYVTPLRSRRDARPDPALRAAQRPA